MHKETLFSLEQLKNVGSEIKGLKICFVDISN